MHTVIGAFNDNAQAQRSIDRLVELGVRRGDIHIEHRGLHRAPAFAAFAEFFASLLGQGKHSEDAARYTRAVESGQHVVVLDALDKEQAGQASDMLAGMGAQSGSVIHRPLLRPLRDIVAVRGVLADQAAGRGSRRFAERPGSREEQRERALAVGGAQRPLDLRDPVLRPVDKSSQDKPRR